MKRLAIVGLACVNVALLAALLWGVAAEPAHAQGGFVEQNYMLVTGTLSGTTSEAVYVVDIAGQQVIGLEIQRDGKYGFAGYRNLQRDFEAAMARLKGEER